MNRIKTEILQLVCQEQQAKNKIYIAEILEADGIFHVYINYGKCTQENLARRLMLTTEYDHNANAELMSVVSKKIKEGYSVVPNGTHLNLPGFAKLLRNPKAVKKPVDKAPEPEHRKLRIY